MGLVDDDVPLTGGLGSKCPVRSDVTRVFIKTSPKRVTDLTHIDLTLALLHDLFLFTPFQWELGDAKTKKQKKTSD